ncbi:MAG TPA: carotenoid biosynthesis protein [Gemmatimonadaceae bacterium]|nr:carotenoid biosynthesis protein [Gemmatimonadaceae bacterium]
MAVALFWAHVALVVFSTAAMLTVLAGPPGPWVAREPHATVMRLGFRFAGPAYVTLGALAAFAFLWSRTGGRRAFAVAATVAMTALGAELVGTGTGLPFGDYRYSSLLGYRIFGQVPFPIPLSWFTMLVGALAIVARLRPAADDRATRWRWAVLAGLCLLAWDVAMDPAMVRTGHWAWGDGAMFRDAGLPGAVEAFFTQGVFYGMPLANWLGWLLTGTVVARVMLAMLPPTRVASALAPSRFPVGLYVVNGVMPVALCLRDGLWWAAAGGALAMGVPAALALWRVPAAERAALREQPA